MNMHATSPGAHGSVVTTFLFTDIEGSTRLWEDQPERMRTELARHDAILRDAVQAHRGVVVKSTGDGLYAAFADPLDALIATVALQHELARSRASDVPIHVRCGLHAGVVEQRDQDYFGTAVNRAQRIMSAGHGGQVLLSQVVADLVRSRLPEDSSLLDLGVVRLRDIAVPEHLFQLVHPGLRRDFPALRSLAATPTNLPHEVKSFIGRERDVRHVVALLGQTRLLTLQGAGGIGKTRLLLHVARAALHAFPDGVWFVELAALADASLVPQALASVLGLKPPPDRAVIDITVEHLRERRALVVLDNCEHLVEACANLARDLLQSAAGVKVIASSREPLHVAGEATYAVPPLATPRADTRLDALSEYASVQLFAERATEARPDFRLGDQNARDVAAICRRLDGIPLALELAAARIRSLSVEQIAERLDHRFTLLTGGDRLALPRQQTLRALIDWSYELLSGSERTLLARLSVFAGGWTLDAAEMVCAGPPIDRAQVLDQLAMLVDKSLVLHELDTDRYRLLETVQQYAQERLADSGEERATRDAHLAYYLALAQKARPELVGPQQRAWLERLDAERNNVLAAHAWCDDATNGATRDLELLSATRRYWIFSGALEIGYRLATEALARAGAQAANLARCQALFDLGQIASYMGRYSESRRHLEQSLAIAREIGDERRMAVALQPLAIACMDHGELDRAHEYLASNLAIGRSLGDRREIATAVNALGQLHRMQMNLDEAERHYRDTLSIGRELDDPEIMPAALVNLASVAMLRRDVHEARALTRQALQLAASQTAVQSVLDACAALAAGSGDCASAAFFFGAADAQMQRTGLRRDPADAAFLEPLLNGTRSGLGEGAWETAERLGRDADPGVAKERVRRWLEQPTA